MGLKVGSFFRKERRSENNFNLKVPEHEKEERGLAFGPFLQHMIPLLGADSAIYSLLPVQH
jgi:hypothetical protein